MKNPMTPPGIDPGNVLIALITGLPQALGDEYSNTVIPEMTYTSVSFFL